MTFIAIALVLCGAAAAWFLSELQRPGPLKTPKVSVVKGSATDVAERLEADGVITSQHLFAAYYRGRQLSTLLGGRPLAIKAGEYDFKPNVSLFEVGEILSEGRSTLLYRLTIPEGLTSHQIIERLRADPGLSGEITEVPAEGSLYPDTYKFSRGMSRSSLIEMMQAEQRRFLEKAWAARQPNLPLKTLEEALIMASIVEKETGRNDERERVASVFINRLRAGMRLQSDPTILYGVSGGQVTWGRPIYKSEIAQKTAHNTYQIDGLPATPICNPGRAAIEAALNPVKSGDLYFVADGQGGHVFSATLKDHNTAVTTWRKVEKDIRAKQATSPAGPGAAGEAGNGQVAAQPPPAAAGAAEDVPLPVRKPKQR